MLFVAHLCKSDESCCTCHSTTINFMDVMVYEVSRHFWKLAVSAGSVLVFCYASLMPVSLAVACDVVAMSVDILWSVLCRAERVEITSAGL